MQSPSPQELVGPCCTTRLLVSMLKEVTRLLVVIKRKARRAGQWVLALPMLAAQNHRGKSLSFHENVTQLLTVQNLPISREIIIASWYAL
jgi:hypothetical protein